MKSYNNLWNSFISYDNIALAINNAAKGNKSKRTKSKLLKYKNNIDKYVPVFQALVHNYTNAEHHYVQIYDGISRKQRNIIVPTAQEQVVHHMLINILKPIFMRSMYAHTYGSIPDRGMFDGKAQLEKWLPCTYVVKLDIRKYFDNVDQDILLSKLRKLIRDDKFYSVLETVVHVVPSGIPIGFYTSQWFANYYLTQFDHYVVQDLHATHYIRYMDDMVICTNDKAFAHFVKDAIQNYLAEELHLALKSNWQVFRMNNSNSGRPIDFMGFKFYNTHTVLRKSLYYKACRKARHIVKYDKYDWYNATQFLSYTGWFKYTDTKYAYKQLTQYIDIPKLKHSVSAHSRREHI